MKASSLLLCAICSLTVFSVQGYSEPIIFTKLKRNFHPIPVIIDKQFTIDCSVSNDNVKISLYKKTSDGKKEIVKVDGENVKRKGNSFELVIKSYFESTDFYCHGELHGTAYEKAVKLVIIATSQELSPTPEIFPGLSKVHFGEKVEIKCKCKGQLSVISWFKDGERLKSGVFNINIHKYFNQRTRESTSILIVSNLTRKDAGVYRCQATSKLQPGYFSFIDSKVEIKDLKKTYWMRNVEDGLVLVQKYATAVLDCSMSNSEKLVTFYRLGRFGMLHKIPVYKIGKFDYIGMQKLLISNTSLDDMGIYVCKTDGISDKQISLFVSPDSDSICHMFKPNGLRILCKNNPSHFKQYMIGHLRKITGN